MSPGDPGLLFGFGSHREVLEPSPPHQGEVTTLIGHDCPDGPISTLPLEEDPGATVPLQGGAHALSLRSGLIGIPLCLRGNGARSLQGGGGRGSLTLSLCWYQQQLRAGEGQARLVFKSSDLTWSPAQPLLTCSTGGPLQGPALQGPGRTRPGLHSPMHRKASTPQGRILTLRHLHQPSPVPQPWYPSPGHGAALQTPR